MKETFALTPVYTGDVSGGCSALYELGGMVVIHDPSGCNSTYNTHDETRWYDEESLIFITGVTMRDIALGNDRKLIADILESAEDLHPAFIALCTSPLAFLGGTDFAGIARLIEKKTDIPCFFVPANGMHDYIYGAGLAWKLYLEHVLFSKKVKPAEKQKKPDSGRLRVNLLGLSPLDFTNENTVPSLRFFLEKYGFEAGVTFAQKTDRESARRLPDADINLVLSASAVPAAEFLRDRFGQPFVLGVPIGDMKEAIALSLRMAVENAGTEGFIRAWDRAADRQYRMGDNGQKTDLKSNAFPELFGTGSRVALIGEAVCMKSLAAALRGRSPESEYFVICPLEKSEGILEEAERDCCVQGEQQVQKAASDADFIIADPLYRPLFPHQKFIDLPSLAYSGRIYLDQIPDYASEAWDTFLPAKMRF